MKKNLTLKNDRVRRLLPRIMLLLICLQPILDIVSYWQTELAIPISLSFAPRAIVFVLLFLGGLILSDNKKAYWIMLGIVGAFWIAHVAVCRQNGMTVGGLINDTSYFISVLQLPVSAFSMITCLKITGEDGLEALFGGIFWSLVILLVSFAVAFVTGTEPHTYQDSQKGICGYCFWPNAQSAILCLSAPISIAYILRKKNDKWLLCIAVIVVSLSILYLHGTRLSFLCLMMTGIGMVVVLILTKQKRRYIITTAVVVALFAATFYLSPMFQNRSYVSNYTEKKASASDRLLELGEKQIRNGCSRTLAAEGAITLPTGMQAFALPEPMTQSTFADMEPVDIEEGIEKIEDKADLKGKNAAEKALIRLRTTRAVEVYRYNETMKAEFAEELAYVQLLELVTSEDKMYNFNPFRSVRVIDAICSVDRAYELYTGERELADWQDAGTNWFDVFIERSKLYGFDGKLIYQDNPWSTCTRGEAAELIYRALPREEYPQIRDIDAIPDMDPADPYYEAALTLYRAGVINDTEQHTDFRPNAPITHLSYAAWLAAAVNPEFRICDDGYTVTLPQKLQTVDPDSLDESVRSDATLFPLYNYFIYGMVERFGIRTVAEQYERTTNTSAIIDERMWKLQYCYILMKQSTPLTKLFGLEADRMLFKGYSYDVENDVHAIYLRFGIVGVVLMCAFLLYFIFIVTKALIKNPKQIFTLEAGAVGIALLGLFMHTYYTCGVLRRANTLHYFGVLLALAYYLVKLKQYPPLPETEKKPKKARKQKD